MKRLYLTEADRTIIPDWLQTKYELGKITKEELDAYASGNAKFISDQVKASNQTVPTKEQMDQ